MEASNRSSFLSLFVSFAPTGSLVYDRYLYILALHSPLRVLLSVHLPYNLAITENSFMHTITEESILTLQLKPFRKVSLLRARKLSQEDYQRRDGAIQTLEGRVSFQPEDYLAYGIENEEWPITRQRFQQNYQRVMGPDEDGYAYYQAIDTRSALQIKEPFCVVKRGNIVLTGKPGDYVVRSGNHFWITDRSIFERSYIPLF